MRFNLLQICHYYSLQNYLDSITNESNKEYNEKWLFIPDHPYRILIIGGSGSGKTNTLLNLINEQNDIDKIYLYARDLNEPKYKILIKKRKDAGIKHLNDPNAFIECSNTMDDVFENIHDYKIKYFTCFYYSILFFCSKRCQIKFNTLFDYENQQQKRITKYCN